ncbi:zinc finger protein 664-like isoform X3 [Belonocnema kinseyi]|nr:zinc finger protein 664-like isoform X3 [Belonocnema kinseyi]
MDINDINTKMKFSSGALEADFGIKSELPAYNSVEESYLTEAENKLMNLINGDIHELPEYEIDSLEMPATKLESIHRCYQCQEEFETAESLRYHISANTKNNLIMPHVKSKNVTSKSCDKQIQMSNKSQKKSPQSQHNNATLNKLLGAKKESFVCNMCGRSHKTMSSLKVHNKNKHQYKCANCGKGCKTAYLLQIHMRVHSEEKPYQCDICKKELKYWQSLKSHVQAHMEGGRPYKCPICSMAFPKDYYLSMHMLKHTGDKKYACEVCNMAFRRKDVLKSHMLVHRNKKCFLCDVCNKYFAKSTYLKEHKKIHLERKRYVCKFCGKAFIYAFYLNTHIRTHTGEKPFECDICQKRFARRFSVTKHKRIHMKVRKIKKTADRKNRKQKAYCDNDSKTAAGHKKEETLINFVDQKETLNETATAS